MAATLGELFDQCGVPRVLMSNSRKGIFDDPFLLIRSFIAVPARNYRRLRDRLEAMGIVTSRATTHRGPRGGSVPTIEVAVAADVTGLGQEELDRALTEGRVLRIWHYSSMGDGYVGMEVSEPGLQPNQIDGYGFYFLFEPPCDLRELDLPDNDAWHYDSAAEFLGFYWQRYLTRELPVDTG